MGLLDHYKQFEEMPREEISAQLRVEADDRRLKALARVEPLDLSRTTWPHLPPSDIVNAITFAARRGLHQYLESPGELLNELSERHGLPAERIVIGDGAAQLLLAATHALMEPGDELVTPWPSYPLYPVMARQARGNAVPVPGFSVDALLSAVNEHTRIIAVCNPNDPTGELLPVGELERLLEALPERVIVLLDEALRDFVDDEERDAALQLTDTHPRLLCFRTFSKAWGLAGLRCGYVMGGPGSEHLLTELAPPTGISELAHAGVLESLRSAERVLRRRVGSVVDERRRLIAALGELPVDVTPSQANVLWLEAHGIDGAELTARLARTRIVVRGGGPLGDQQRIRVAIHDGPTTDRFLRALAAVLETA